MAIYRFSMKHGSRAKGSSSAAHYNYILREKRYQYGAHELVHSESSNIPKWATSANDFWKAADEFEACNARLYTEFEIALPRELTTNQQIRLAKDFIQTEIGKSHPYTMAIHESTAQDGKPNPHVHVMFTARSLDDGIERSRKTFFKRANSKNPEEGGAPKDRQWMTKEKLLNLRESWESHANLALKRAGHTTVIDHRTLKAQGIDRIPEPKLSPYESMLWKHGIVSEKVEDVLLLRKLTIAQEKLTDLETIITKLDELGNLMSFEERVEETIKSEQKLLKSTLRERERVDNRIAGLNSTLMHAPGSPEDALEMAKDRLYGRAIGAHIESIELKQQERDQIVSEIGSQVKQGLGIITNLPLIFQESNELLEVQRQVNVAKNTYARLLEEIASPQEQADCKQFAEELYARKVENETERNGLLEDAFSIRDQISNHEAVIADLQRMLAETKDEMLAIDKTLPPDSRILIAVEEEMMTVGQEVRVEEEQISQKQTQELKLQISLKLSKNA